MCNTFHEILQLDYIYFFFSRHMRLLMSGLFSSKGRQERKAQACSGSRTRTHVQFFFLTDTRLTGNPRHRTTAAPNYYCPTLLCWHHKNALLKGLCTGRTSPTENVWDATNDYYTRITNLGCSYTRLVGVQCAMASRSLPIIGAMHCLW